MASDDANVPSNPAVQNSVLRNCEKCNADMKQLAVLPALSIYAAIKVFRCYACDRVVSEQAWRAIGKVVVPGSRSKFLNQRIGGSCAGPSQPSSAF